jgi:hypothetical protein
MGRGKKNNVMTYGLSDVPKFASTRKTIAFQRLLNEVRMLQLAKSRNVGDNVVPSSKSCGFDQSVRLLTEHEMTSSKSKVASMMRRRDLLTF